MNRPFTAMVMGLALALAGCGSQPPVPDWRVAARGAADRALAAYLSGNPRVATAEFERLRADVSATGRPERVAEAELLRCAAQVASLVFGPCEGFARLREDASDAQRAYADYLSGAALTAGQRALLPPAQRGGGGGLADLADPLSQLVAAAVLLQTSQASPQVVALATETASAQGWRRPLLAWLGVQLALARKAGASAEASRIERRIALVGPPGP